jgi:hypothetical protein
MAENDAEQTRNVLKIKIHPDYDDKSLVSRYRSISFAVDQLTNIKFLL